MVNLTSAYQAIQCQCATNDAIVEFGKSILITDTEREISEKATNAVTLSTFVVYIIRFQDKIIRRRYSDFSSFRAVMMRLYPGVLVPPIPEKHSLYYAFSQKRINEDHTMIEKRKRMLERFLQRVATHSILRHDHTFHLFLSSESTWSDIYHASPISAMPKDPLLSLVLGSKESSFTSLANGASGLASSNILPVPTLSHTLKAPDPRFVASEFLIDKHMDGFSLGLDKVQRRIIRRLGELTVDYSELSSTYSMLSLNETAAISEGIKSIGKAMGSIHAKSQQMIQSLEIEFAEHLQELTQYMHIAKQALCYRRMKQAQLELVAASLESKKTLLANLQKMEDEALRLEAELSKTDAKFYKNENSDCDDFDTRSIEDGFASIDIPSSTLKHTQSERQQDSADISSGNESLYPAGASASAIRESRSRTKKWSSPRKLLNAMTFTLQGIMDPDPEATRRSQIAKLQDTVTQLESAAVLIEKELDIISETIQNELDDFKKQKSAEMRAMIIAYARIHQKYCEENVQSWLGAREKLDRTVALS